MAQETWKEDLFGCFNNIDVCLLSCLCYPCYNGYVYARIRAVYGNGEGKCTAFFCSCCCSCFGDGYNRMHFRNAYKINGNYIGDCLISCCCPPCSIAQVDREQIYRKAKKQKNENIQKQQENQNQQQIQASAQPVQQAVIFQQNQPATFQQNQPAIFQQSQPAITIQINTAPQQPPMVQPLGQPYQSQQVYYSQQYPGC